MTRALSLTLAALALALFLNPVAAGLAALATGEVTLR